MFRRPLFQTFYAQRRARDGGTPGPPGPAITTEADVPITTEADADLLTET